jgi:hypothetical protein
VSEFDVGCADAIVAGYLVTGCGNCCIFEGQLYYMIAVAVVASQLYLGVVGVGDFSVLVLVEVTVCCCRPQNSPACLSAAERRRNKRMQQENATRDSKCIKGLQENNHQ